MILYRIRNVDVSCPQLWQLAQWHHVFIAIIFYWKQPFDMHVKWNSMGVYGQNLGGNKQSTYNIYSTWVCSQTVDTSKNGNISGEHDY
jgi:hypothetical protein